MVCVTPVSIICLFCLPFHRRLPSALIGLSAARQTRCHMHDYVMHQGFAQVDPRAEELNHHQHRLVYWL